MISTVETPWDQIMCDRTKWVLPDHLKASVQQVADQGVRSNVGTVLAHLVPTPLQGGVGTCQQHAQEVLAHGVLTAGSRGVRTHW